MTVKTAREIIKRCDREIAEHEARISEIKALRDKMERILAEGDEK